MMDPKLHSEKCTRQLIYWQLEDMGIDATSPLGLYVIDHYKPAWACGAEFIAVHGPEAIQKYIDQQWTGGA